MSSTIYLPNLKAEGERAVLTGTKVTDAALKDHSCIDTYVYNDALNPIHVTGSAGDITFKKDGVSVNVNEDTITPANNVPLPVKLSSVTGDINITAGDLNVHLSHAGVNYDSTRIGDGTNLLGITALNEAKVIINSELPSGDNNIGNVDIVTLPSIPSGDNNIGNVDVLTQPVRSHVSDSIRIGDGIELAAVTPSGQLEVAVTAALPSGTNNIGDVDVLTLPSIPSGTNTIGKIDQGLGGVSAWKVDGEYSAVNAATLPSKVAVVAGYDGANVRAVKVDNTGIVEVSGNVNANCSGSVTVSSGNVTVAGTVTANQGTLCTVVDFLDTPLLNASSTNIPASASTPLTVVASLAANVKKIQILDTTGSFIGLYADPAGTPVLKAIIGPGSDSTIELSLTAGTVLGLRNMENSAITVGNVAINFMG